MTETVSAHLARFGLSRPGCYVPLSGLAWGCIVTTAESLTQPPLDLSFSEYFTFYSRILLHYCAAGVLLAWLTSRISNFDRRLPALAAVVPVLFVAMAAALLLDRLSLRYVPFWRNDLMAVMAPRLPDLAAHFAWIFSAYGGLYVATFFFLRNEMKTHERLRRNELARIRAEDRMDRALAEDTSPAIAPDLLLQALSELAERYDQNDQRADRLLNKLVGVLRSVSGAKGKSRRGREDDLAVSVSQLCRELERTNRSPVLNRCSSHAGGRT